MLLLFNIRTLPCSGYSSEISKEKSCEQTNPHNVYEWYNNGVQNAINQGFIFESTRFIKKKVGRSTYTIVYKPSDPFHYARYVYQIYRWIILGIFPNIIISIVIIYWYINGEARESFCAIKILILLLCLNGSYYTSHGRNGLTFYQMNI